MRQRAREHAIQSRRPRRPAHASPLRRWFAPDPLPTLPPPNPTSQLTTATHHHSHHLPEPARPHTTCPKALPPHQPPDAQPDPRQPSHPASAQPSRSRSASSKKHRRPASLSSSAPLCKLSLSSVLHRLEVRVGSSPGRRPELGVDALDARPRSASLDAMDPALLRHSGRRVSAVRVDGSMVGIRRKGRTVDPIDSISSSKSEGLSSMCTAVANGRVSAGIARCAEEGGGKLWRFCSRAVHGRRAGSPKPSSRGSAHSPRRGLASPRNRLGTEAAPLPTTSGAELLTSCPRGGWASLAVPNSLPTLPKVCFKQPLDSVLRSFRRVLRRLACRQTGLT